jgi:hypothetical protein
VGGRKGPEVSESKGMKGLTVPGVKGQVPIAYLSLLYLIFLSLFDR